MKLTDTDVAFAIKKVGSKVRWLVRSEHIRLDEAEDFSQDLLYDIVASFRLFNPARATAEGFIIQVVKLRSRSRLRDLRAARRRRPVPSGRAGVEYDTPDPRLDAERDLLDDRIDLDEVLERLPEKLAAICEGLRNHSVKQFAERTGIPRANVQYALRRAKKDADKKNCIAALRRFTNAATRREGEG